MLLEKCYVNRAQNHEMRDATADIIDNVCNDDTKDTVDARDHTKETAVTVSI